MAIKLRLNEVLSVNECLKAIIDDNQSKTDALFKFRLLGIMKEISSHVSNFNVVRNEKIIEYGERTKKGNYQISKENKDAMTKFNYDMDALLKSEVTINIDKLKANDVFNRGVKAKYLIGLYPIIEK